MIELRTGVPGSGKTLSMVEALSKLLASWEKKPEDLRPVFVHNIKDLALAHAVMPVIEQTMGARKQLVPDWDAMPDGSLVIIDECQDVLPPRSSQSAAPAHIAFLNTHRHKGFDIWLTTQHPKLIDFSARALVGKHQHFRRLFGGQRAAVYEWDGCSDSLGGMKDAVMSFYHFPKKAFQFYKSAEVHTKQSFKLPRWLLVPIAGLLLGVFAIPKAYTTLSGAVSGKGLAGTAEAHRQEVAQAPGKMVSASAPIQAASAPGQQQAPTEAKPVAAGCIFTSKRGCKCFDAAGKTFDEDKAMCEVLIGPAAALSADLLPTPQQQPLAPSEADIELAQYAAKGRNRAF